MSLNVNGKVVEVVTSPEGLPAVDGEQLLNAISHGEEAHSNNLADLIRADQKKRLAAGQSEIAAVLQKYKLEMHCSMTIQSDGRIIPDISLFAK